MNCDLSALFYPLEAALERLTRTTPPTTSPIASTFCQVNESIPTEMLMTVAMMGCR